jgi:hypothetical protein
MLVGRKNQNGAGGLETFDIVAVPFVCQIRAATYRASISHSRPIPARTRSRKTGIVSMIRPDGTQLDQGASLEPEH